MNNNKLTVKNRTEFRQWLDENSATERECWIVIKRGRPTDDEHFWYIDAVEEALCFGWIDSVWKNVDGIMWSRFTPRQKKSLWTELNKERVRRLERLGLMTDAGRVVLPDMDVENFCVDEDVETALKSAGVWSKFKSFPPLYQRIRAYNVAFYKNKNHEQYEKSLKHLVEATAKGEMFGEWNDYGRLLEDEDNG